MIVDLRYRLCWGAAVALLLVFLGVAPGLAQGSTGPVDLLSAERARSESYPVSVAIPPGWQSFQGDPKVPGEVLFLQTAEGSLLVTVSFAVFPMPHSWADLLKRETWQLVVELDAPVLADEALTLRGAKGHKWVYRGYSSAGDAQVYYRLYLSLPGTLGTRRLLVMHATAPAEGEAEALDLFGSLSRSLTWGSDAAP